LAATSHSLYALTAMTLTARYTRPLQAADWWTIIKTHAGRKRWTFAKLLGEHKAFVFTLIQKFNKKIEKNNPYSDRDDIIVISDEAHRTQYGTLAINMREALPSASYIGFTGTPLFKD